MTEVWSIMLAAVSSIFYGAADFLGGSTARRLHVLQVVAVSAPASLLIELALLPVFQAHFSTTVILWGVLSGISSAAAFTLLYLALARGPMSVLSPVTAAVSAAVPVAVGLTMATATPSIWEVVGLVLAAPAILLLSSAPPAPGQARVQASSVIVALGAGAAIGVQLVCLRQAPIDSGVGPLVVGRATASVILGLAAALLLPRARPSWPGWRALGIAAAAGILDSLANLFFLLSARIGELAVSGLIVALYPATTVVLARILLKERVGWRAIVGIVLALTSIGLLAA